MIMTTQNQLDKSELILRCYYYFAFGTKWFCADFAEFAQNQRDKSERTAKERKSEDYK